MSAGKGRYKMKLTIEELNALTKLTQSNKIVSNIITTLNDEDEVN